jgi:hypothetical protein
VGLSAGGACLLAPIHDTAWMRLVLVFKRVIVNALIATNMDIRET